LAKLSRDQLKLIYKILVMHDAESLGAKKADREKLNIALDVLRGAILELIDGGYLV